MLNEENSVSATTYTVRGDLVIRDITDGRMSISVSHITPELSPRPLFLYLDRKPSNYVEGDSVKITGTIKDGTLYIISISR